MKVVIQYVEEAKVEVDNKLINSINRGYMILVGLTHSDDEQVVTKMAEKILKLRVIPDEDDKMNLSIKDIEGEILSISQFTLYADSKKGNRPSYTDAMHPDRANELYELFNSELNKEDRLLMKKIRNA